MRVAICSVGELFGGVERHILGAIDILLARGLDPLLLLFQDAELAAQARVLGCSPIILPASNRHIVHGAKSLARVLAQEGSDILHVHGYKATVFASIARCWYRCALVKTEHGLPEFGAGPALNKLRIHAYHALETTATQLGRASVCYVTQELYDYHRLTHAGLSRTVIPNAVPDLEPSAVPRPVEFLPDNFNLVLVGRLDTVKGIHVALHALATAGSSTRVHLYVIGDGPLAHDLRSEAGALGIASRVHFLGFQREIYGYLAHADALVMPSLHEGLPYTLLEAMAFRRPIIASNVGGLAETLTDGVNSLLFETKNAAALAHAISAILQDPSLGQRLGKAAQTLQRNRYSLSAMMDRYFEVYRHALGQ